MATICFSETTTATPEQIVAGITDFGPGRAELFANSTDEYLKVHAQSPGHADVTEGSHGVWERLNYDWSETNRVVLTTTDSNVWGQGSGHTYVLTPQSNGTTKVDVVVVRVGKSFKGRGLALLVPLVGRRFVAGAFRKTISAIEARNENGSEGFPAAE